MLSSSPHADRHHLLHAVNSNHSHTLSQVKEYLANPEAFAVAAPVAAEEAAPAAAAAEEEKKEEEEEEDEDMVCSLYFTSVAPRLIIVPRASVSSTKRLVLLWYLHVSIRIIVFRLHLSLL